MLGAVEFKTIGLAHECAGLHTQQSIVCFVVVLIDVMRVVGGQKWRTNFLRELNEFGVGANLVGNAVILDFDEQVVLAENVLQTSGLLHGTFFVAIENGLKNMATQTTGGGNEPGRVFLEQFPVDAWLVVIALEKRKAGQLNEVAVALIVFSQQREVVVLLASALVDASVVVHTSATCNAFGAVVVSHIGLGADDGLNALLTTFVIELDNAIHVAVVGDAQCRLTIGNSFCHQLVEARCAIEHGVFRMNVKVCK